MRVVSTSRLPIRLDAQVRAHIPGARVDVPDHWVGIDGVDLTDADALVCLLMDRIDDAVLARAPKLKLVANCAVGVDNIDLAACAARNVVVTNTPDVLTDATAELTIALMFAAARRLPEGDRLLRGGGWEGWRLGQLLGVGLSGKQLGIVGYGRIGRAVATKARGLGMRVVFADDPQVLSHRSATRTFLTTPSAFETVTPPPDPAPVHVGVDALFAESDVVSLHCPLTPATTNLVDARRLATMKRTGIVINTARGKCVDIGALVDALTREALFAAALDVFPDEPKIDPRLLSCPRVVLAPHIGSATTEARTQMAQLCADAVIAILTGNTPTNVVHG